MLYINALRREKIMRILGIDPGYGITGFGIVYAQRGQCQLLRCGAITTPPNSDFYWRLSVIYNDMVQLLLAEKPDADEGGHRHGRAA